MIEKTTTYSRPTLSVREREIAIEAIGRQVTGSPRAMASDLLAAIAVLDGEHIPVVIWSGDFITYQAKAAWHQQQAADWQDQANRQRQLIDSRTSSEAQSQPSEPPSAEPAPEPGLLLRLPALDQSIPAEEEKENPLPLLAYEPEQESSDAC